MIYGGTELGWYVIQAHPGDGSLAVGSRQQRLAEDDFVDNE